VSSKFNHYKVKTAGVILAGGRATRMAHQDKGLVMYKNNALIRYAMAALAPVVDQLFINANRNLDTYQRFGWQVISDHTDSYDGPLAGVYAALAQTDAEHLIVIPCDCPLIATDHIQKLLQQHLSSQSDITVASDGTQLHPVFFTMRTALQENLAEFLTSGQRKVGHWLAQHPINRVDFSAETDIFTNINSLHELSLLEMQHSTEQKHL
jgi:molybdenum cofactor guanylyltransferase